MWVAFHLRHCATSGTPPCLPPPCLPQATTAATHDRVTHFIPRMAVSLNRLCGSGGHSSTGKAGSGSSGTISRWALRACLVVTLALLLWQVATMALGGSLGTRSLLRPESGSTPSSASGGLAALPVSQSPPTVETLPQPPAGRPSAPKVDKPPTKAPSPAQSPGQPAGTHAPAPAGHAVQIMVLTYNRLEGLKRLLESLVQADYTGLPPHHLRLCVDRPEGGDPDAAILAAMADFTWSHGTFEVGVQRQHQGLAKQWLTCWEGASLERQGGGGGSLDDSAATVGMVLEDDMVVSPHWARWIQGAAAAYEDSDVIRSFTLQRPQLRASDGGSIAENIPAGATVVGYRLLGSWGFGVFRDTWRDFVQWQRSAAAAGQDPSVPGLVLTDWWRTFKQQGKDKSMWTMWFAKFAQDKNLFTLYGALGGDLGWAANWRDPGEHYHGKSQGPDSVVVPFWRAEYGVFPAEPVLLDWNGALAPGSAQVQEAETAALASLLKLATPDSPAGFAGLVILNDGFVEMTLSWLCNTAGMPGVHERTIMACTDSSCLRRMRSSPLASRVGGLMSIDLFKRAEHIPGADKQALKEQQKGALEYATPTYVLMMVARQRLLADLVQRDIAYLLFETDALWAVDAYAWIDDALASGTVGDYKALPSLQPSEPAFDFIGYVDVQPDKIGGGFFLATSSPRCKEFFQEWSSSVDADMKRVGLHGAKASQVVSDQVMLQRVFDKHKPEGHVAYFPPAAFPSGEWYKKHPASEGGFAAAKKAGLVVLQFNWVYGLNTKVERAKRYQHWFLDGEGKCISM